MQRLEVSGAVRHLYGSLGVKGLIGNPEKKVTSVGKWKWIILTFWRRNYFL
jgi:hypothetical protein